LPDADFRPFSADEDEFIVGCVNPDPSFKKPSFNRIVITVMIIGNNPLLVNMMMTP
jgi:hypothetical protein